MMVTRHTLLFAALTSFVSAHAATSDKGLPSAGSSIALSPTPAGYEASFDVGTDQDYTAVDVRSSDLKVAAQVLKTESTPAKVKRVIVRLDGGKYHLTPYSLTIVADHVLVQGKKKIREEVERDVWLQIPAATLDPPQTLSIDRLCWTVVGSKCELESVSATQPQLWESTQRAWVTGIELSQKGDTEAGGEPAGTIQAGPTKVEDIVPGVSRRLQLGSNYKLSGEFPLGTSKGKLLVQADQLSAPVALDFEIHTRTSRWLLLIGLALGLLLGWLTRDFLKTRLELNQQKQKTFALLDLVGSTKAHTEDEAVGKRLDALLQRLETAAESKAIDTVNNESSAVQTDFNTLLEESRSRRAQIDQGYSDALALIETRWRLSAIMQGSLAKARAVLHAQAAVRARNNYTEEERVLESSLRDLLQEARPEVDRYATARAALDALALTLKPLMDRVGAASVLDSLTKPPDKPKAAPAPQKPEARIEALRANLEYLYLARAYVADMCSNMQVLLTSQFKTWDQQLGHAHLPHAEMWAEWLQGADAFVEKLEAVSSHDGEKAGGLDAPAAQLATNLKRTLRSQLKDSDPELEAKLAASAFGDAVSLVEESTRRRINVSLPEGALFLRSPASPMGLVDWRGPPRHSGQLLVTRWRAELPTVASTLVPPPPPDVSSLAVLAASSRRSIETIGGVLNLVYAAIILAGGYFLFADKWVGTLLDFMIAFFWAYATDIGADAATTAVKGLKR